MEIESFYARNGEAQNKEKKKAGETHLLPLFPLSQQKPTRDCTPRSRPDARQFPTRNDGLQPSRLLVKNHVRSRNPLCRVFLGDGDDLARRAVVRPTGHDERRMVREG
jgi:hypothetical protein